MTLDAAADDAAAEADLGPDGEAEWARLRRQLELADGFWLGFVFSSSPAVATTLRRRTDHVLALRAAKLEELLPPDPDALRASLRPLFDPGLSDAACVWIQAVVADRGPWQRAWDDVFLRLNERRDSLRRNLNGGLVLAAPTSAKPRVRDAAPDLWSIRSLVIELRSTRRLSPDSEWFDARAGAQAPTVMGRALLPPATSPEGKKLLDRADHALAAGRTDEAVEAGRAAVAHLRQGADAGELAGALTLLSRADEAHGDEAAAIDHAKDALSRIAGVDLQALRLELLDRIGRLALAREDLAAADEAFAACVDAARDLCVALSRAPPSVSYRPPLTSSAGSGGAAEIAPAQCRSTRKPLAWIVGPPAATGRAPSGCVTCRSASTRWATCGATAAIWRRRRIPTRRPSRCAGC